MPSGGIQNTNCSENSERAFFRSDVYTNTAECMTNHSNLNERVQIGLAFHRLIKEY